MENRTEPVEGYPIIGALRRNYAARLVVLLVVVGVTIAAFGGLIYVQTGESLQDDVEQDMQHSSELQATAVSQWLNGSTGQAETVAHTETLQSGDDDRIGDYLDGQHERMDDAVVGIHYVDQSTDRIRVSTVEGLSGQLADQKPWTGTAHESESGESVLTDPYRDSFVDTAVGGLVTPVSEDRTLVVLYDLETLSDRLEYLDESPDAFTHVVDPDGTVILSHDAETIGERTHHTNEYDFSNESGYTELTPANGEGGAMAMGYSSVDGTDWTLMTHQPGVDAFELQTQITRSVFALILVSFMGLVSIGAVVGRNTTRSIRDLAESANELGDGNLDVPLETNRVDEIGQLYAALDTMRTSLRTSINNANRAKARAQDRERAMRQLADHLESKAEQFRDVMERAADGDLTARMDEESESKAMREIAAEYNRMMDEMAETTARLKRFASDVAVHSQLVTENADEVHRTGEEVTTSLQTISRTTDGQHESYRIVLDRMEALAETTREIESISDQVTGTAEQTKSASEDGTTAAKEAVEEMAHIDQDADEAVEAIEHLQTQVGRIEEITEFIATVARQTNMLALNANIEASRSEPGDEGFSAVAEEVKELSSDVHQSAGEIEAVVREIDEQVDHTASAFRSTREEIRWARDTVEQAVVSLEAITQYARQTHDGTRTIHTDARQQADSIENVAAMVDQAESLSRRVSNAASGVAAAANDQTSSLTEVSQSARDLSTEAHTLQQELERFKTARANSFRSAPTDN